MEAEATVCEGGLQYKSGAFDLFDYKLRHQTVRDKFDSVFVHLREKLLAGRVDEAHVGQIDHRRHRCFASDCAAPAFFEFADTRATESPFNKETKVAGDFSGADA